MLEKLNIDQLIERWNTEKQTVTLDNILDIVLNSKLNMYIRAVTWKAYTQNSKTNIETSYGNTIEDELFTYLLQQNIEATLYDYKIENSQITNILNEKCHKNFKLTSSEIDFLKKERDKLLNKFKTIIISHLIQWNHYEIRTIEQIKSVHKVIENLNSIPMDKYSTRAVLSKSDNLNNETNTIFLLPEALSKPVMWDNIYFHLKDIEEIEDNTNKPEKITENVNIKCKNKYNLPGIPESNTKKEASKDAKKKLSALIDTIKELRANSENYKLFHKGEQFPFSKKLLYELIKSDNPKAITYQNNVITYGSFFDFWKNHSKYINDYVCNLITNLNDAEKFEVTQTLEKIGKKSFSKFL